MKLIDKSTVVAEINRVLNSYDPNEITSGRYALASLRNFLDTLEVKEVDFDKEFDTFHIGIYNPFESGAEIRKFARHFFELGLNKNLTWQDIKDIAEIGNDFLNSEESDNLDDEAYYTEILNRFLKQCH